MADIRKEHKGKVAIEMERLERTYPVLFTDNDKKVTVKVNDNSGKDSTG